MTCLNTYQLPCGQNCGIIFLQVAATYTGWHWVRWTYLGVTYKKKFWAIVGQQITLLYPFQSHGVYVFQILDEDQNVISYDIDGFTYDCFRAVGVPTYDIPAEELEAIMQYCQENGLNINVGLEGTGTLSIELTLIDHSSPLEFSAALTGTGTLSVNMIFVRAIMEEMTGTGTLTLDGFTVSLGVAPPFLNDDENAYVAYSNRLCHYDYAGDCMEVYRVSDGAVTDIGFNSKNWRDDATLQAFLGVSAGRVRTWYNQTGLGPDLVQTTPAAMLYCANAGGVPIKVNQRAMIYHSGGALGMATGSWAPANAVGTAAWVHHQANLNDYCHLHGGSGSGNFMGYGSTSSGGAHYSGCGTIGAYYVDNVEELVTTKLKYHGNTNNAKHHVWMKGPNTNGWAALEFGTLYAAAGFKGYGGELVVWETDKSASKDTITANQMGVWGL